MTTNTIEPAAPDWKDVQIARLHYAGREQIAAIDRLRAQIDLALWRYDTRSELYTNDADLIAAMVDTLRKP